MSLKTHTIWMAGAGLFFLVYLLAPFNWFIQVESIEYSDMCIGDTKQTVTTNRHAVWDISGEADTLLIFYTDDNLRIETDIRRSSTFTYESDIKDVEFEVEWDKPVTRAGKYGVQSTEIIYPLWFWPIRIFNPAEERTFNVIDCI